MQHEHHRVPVTAVSIWRQHILLSAEGPFLKAYDLRRKALLAVCPIFEGQAVHGIIRRDDSDESLFLAWGGRWVRLIRARHHEEHGVSLEPGNLQDTNDWILDGAFSPPQDDHPITAVLINAHNALLLVEPNGPDVNIRAMISGSNCILYSAHASWLSPSKCLIASGTAFGDVMVWSCTISSEKDYFRAKHQVHSTFLAHEGSVFGLQLAPPAVATALGSRGHVLASCSDDRTVRIWDISNMSVRSKSFAGTERQTGFSHEPDSQADAPPLLGKAMGHLSRIWHVRFYQPFKTSNGCRLITFGEDATTIIWAVEASAYYTAQSPFVLRQIQVERSHSGKNLWAVSVNPGLQIATGGADGAITWLDRAKPQQVVEVETSTLACETKPDHFRAYGLVGPSQIVATTDYGRVLLLERSAQGDSVTKELSGPLNNLCGYSILTSLDRIAFFAGADGVVYMYEEGKTDFQEILNTGRKVVGLFASTESTLPSISEKVGSLLVTNVGARVATLCLFDLERRTDYATKLDVQNIELPDGFIVTSLASFSCGNSHFTIVGARNGLLSVFSSPQEPGPDLPLATLAAHHGETVTYVRVTVRHGQERNFMLYSTGRDGTYAAHLLIVKDNGLIDISTIHQLSLPLGSNIEGIGCAPRGDLMVWGFRSKDFVVFNLSIQQEVMKVDCGGVHRTWCFQLDDEGGTFLWTKASKMYWKTQLELPFRSLNAGGHGREIKSAAVSPSNARLIATGAEDTNIKLSLYDGGFRCLHTLQKHNTGIQHLQWSSDGCLLFSSGGFEEFFVWRITHEVPDLGIGVVCESKHPRSGTSDLRIMNFDVRKEATDQSLDAFCITMVYSDSSMRIWRYDTQSWSLLASGSYLTFCLTQCMVLESITGVITGSTDGHLAMWNSDLAKGELAWNQRHKIHQSAILCMAMHEPRPGCRIVLTGGDDNAIGITRISDSMDLRSLIVPKAHAAAVTAVTVVDHQPDSLWFVSASLDQRIKLWRVDMDLKKPGVEGIDIRLLRNAFTVIADVSSLDKVRTTDGGSGVSVCGVGMDIWRMEACEV